MKGSNTYSTREEWLVALVELLRPDFAKAGLEIPACPVSCGWPSRNVRKVAGQCFRSAASKDGSRHIFVSPMMDDAVEVAAVLTHELVHACLPDGTGHKGPFKRAMKKVGLEGKPTSTHAGEELTQRLNAACKKLGAYPHAKLSLVDAAARQGTRMLKLQCPSCGYTVRTTAKWICNGLPTCACGSQFEEA